MRIISYNVNGIRASVNKGLLEWLATDPADIICLQEVKAHREDIDMEGIKKVGYDSYWACAEKKGYSGVGILTKIKPDKIVEGSSIAHSDKEGRMIRADFNDITVISVYFPSGTSGETRQSYKYLWLDDFFTFIDDLKKKRKKLIICGDYNIAHKEIDIHNPVANKKTTGFLPEERAWMDKFLESGFVDTFRHLNKEPHHYSWWSIMRPSVRLENKGWRIDYITVTENLKNNIKAVSIMPNIKHSDHCPVYADIEV